MIPFLHGALGVAAYASDFELIETQTVGAGGAASITLGSGGTIPQTYKHLQIRGILRDDPTGTDVDSLLIRLNGDTGSNYARHYLNGNGATAASGGGSSQTSGYAGTIATSKNSSIWGANVIDILDYTSTSKNKTVRALSGADVNGAGYLQFMSAVWFATPAAVTSITLFPSDGAAKFVQYSTFSLYGVK